MKNADYVDLVRRLLPVVEAAGRAILKIYGTDFTVQTKEDHSPLTQADMASHKVIEQALKELTPDIPLLSEEAAIPAFKERAGWQQHWLVDPLDGTKEFINRNGEFTVNIALIEGNHPSLGLVGVPLRQEIYVGCLAPKIAEKHTSTGIWPLQPRSMQNRSSLTIVASRSHGGQRLENYLDEISAKFEQAARKPVGSSLKLCLLAEGEADIYPRLGPTSEWDIGAAQAVLEAAGGAVWTFEGNALSYNTKESVLNPEFVAVGDATFSWWDVLPQPKSANRA